MAASAGAIRRIEGWRAYTVDELARLLGVHKNTVRHWIRVGLPLIDGAKPQLIKGREAKVFLTARRVRRRKRCRLEQLYCFTCRESRDPAERMADLLDHPTAPMLRALCATCGGVMNKRVSRRDVARLRELLEVQFMQRERTLNQAPPALENRD